MLSITDLISIFISFISLFVSFYVFWDTSLRFKLSVVLGRQIKLYAVTLDGEKKQPCIFINIDFINVGGKLGYVDSVELLVKMIDGKQIQEFKYFPLREYDTLIGENIIQKEITAISMLGKSSVSKNYIFFPEPVIDSKNVYDNFFLSLELRVFTKGKYRKICMYKSKEINGIWKDLDQQIVSSKIIDIFRE